MSDRNDLLSLRVGLARVAQAMGLDDSIPGRPGKGAGFPRLHNMADAHDRGWNDLCNDMVEKIDQVRELLGGPQQ